MKQILAIFTKDARRFWPEILVSLALLAAFVFVYPSQWSITNGPPTHGFVRGIGSGSPLGFLASFLVVLIPISWWILVARVVHGERLVGDTQFWLTRPYEWPKFLAAKLLVLAVFLYLPFFVAQSLLLHEAGFHPFSYLHGLFYNLLLVSGIVVLPLAAFSSITTGFGRMTLVLLGVILFVAGMALLNSILPADTNGSIPGPLGYNLSLLVLTCGCAAVVVVQFSMRNARLGWLILASVAILLTAIAFFDPDQAIVEHHYPSQSIHGWAPTPISFGTSASRQAMTNETKDKDELEIAVPVRTSEVADGYAVIPVAFKAAIEAGGGARWESPWQVIYNERYLPGISDSTMRFRIRRTVYERFKATAVTLRLTFAVDEAKSADTQSVSLTTSDFFVPGFGICTPQSPWFSRASEITGITCRSAMRQPQLTYVTTHWTEGNCSAADSEKALGTSWVGSFETDPAEFGITSVWDTPLSLSNNWSTYREGESSHERHICPGTSVSFTGYELIARTQVGLTIQNFHLPELSIGDVYLLQMKN
jgi:hypothetical protein